MATGAEAFASTMTVTESEDRAPEGMTGSQARFAERAVRRKRLFLWLAVAGLVIAAGLSAYYTYRTLTDPAFAVGPRMVIVLLILLNSRQNLRQYRYAGVLESLMHQGEARGGGRSA